MAALILLVSAGLASSFTPPFENRRRVARPVINQPVVLPHRQQRQRDVPASSTSLRLLLDVPDAFFTVTFPTLGILLSISKNFARVRMEERAWEQRLEEARFERLQQDPTLTEIDLRRKEAAMEWSAYGKPRMEEERLEREQEEPRGGRRSRVKVLDLEDEEEVDARNYRMTEGEIEAFELEYGVEYDPYYDDPYAEDELPEGKYSVDRLYGDRVFDDGEIFYKDANTGLFYRQGCKPRNLSFWG
jgi:hypothetical protein